VLDFGVTDPLEPDWVNGDDLPVPGATASAETLRYASPEQVRNPSAVDARADVWALGAILYELIAGAPLFQSESPLTLLAMIAADTPTPLGLLRNDVPPELEQLVLGCLEKEPEARPRSVVEVVMGLAPFASIEAQQAAARVARIVMRTTRPPPLPSHLPPSMQSRAGALVRSRPPASLRTEGAPLPPQSRDPRGFGMLFAGAGIGLGASLIAVLVARPPAPPIAAAPVAASVAAAPAATVAPTATALVLPPALAVQAPSAASAVGAPSSAAATLPATAPLEPRPTPRPVARVAERRSTPKAAGTQPSEPDEAAPARARAASKPQSDGAVERKIAVSADALFGGLD
jgi:serine/threonine-protein kinase